MKRKEIGAEAGDGVEAGGAPLEAEIEVAIEAAIEVEIEVEIEAEIEAAEIEEEADQIIVAGTTTREIEVAAMTVERGLAVPGLTTVAAGKLT